MSSHESSCHASPKTRVLIVDDHPAVREGLGIQLESQPDMQICGEAADVPEALAEYEKHRPDVTVVDITLKTGDGIDLTKRIIARDESARVIVWSMHPEHLYAERALRAGAMGFVHKGRETREIVLAIRAVMCGRVYLSDELSSGLLRRLIKPKGTGEGGSAIESLSDRELETFRFIGEGLTTEQIATRMRISPKTVETYRVRIKDKLGVSKINSLVQQAARWTLENH